jgi:DNA-binding CsgD family transcriptional regulator
VRNAFIPPTGLQHPVESAGAADVVEVTAMARRHVGDAEATRMETWWQHHPTGFSVSRDASGHVAAFGLVVESANVTPALLAVDPAARAMAADLGARPLRRGGRALMSRQMLTLDGGAQPCPELALMTVDLKRTYLEMRPDLLRVYTVAEFGSAMAAMVQSLGFAPVECGRAAGLWALEMPEGSVDAWIARHIEFETSPPLPPATTAAPSSVAALSAREREVLAALAEGLSNQELADRLFISERTANRHLSNIFAKLGVRNRTAAARVAIEAGLAN